MEHIWGERIGRVHEESWQVTADMLASSMKSGAVRVLATPYMIALMENACMSLVQPYLDEGIATVGTAVNITHLSPTPIGMMVRTRAELLEADGRRFAFRVSAWDEAGLIGEGTHERCTVKIARFEEKAAAKAQSTETNG